MRKSLIGETRQLMAMACAVCALPMVAQTVAEWPQGNNVPDTPDGGRTLHNGIVLPGEWPPRIDPKDPNPIPAPYLETENILQVIPIDIGRQLFVDDFLVESTNGLVRTFYKPVKYVGNPVMWPETKAERALNTELGDKPFPNKDAKDKDWDPLYKTAPGCCMSGGGVWWDPTRRRFRMWYMSGWSGRIGLAESKDGLVWERPPVGRDGGNIVLPDQKADTFSVFPGYDTDAPYDNWRISISPGGNPTRSAAYVSGDGIRWRFLRHTGLHDDVPQSVHRQVGVEPTRGLAQTLAHLPRAPRLLRGRRVALPGGARRGEDEHRGLRALARVRQPGPAEHHG